MRLAFLPSIIFVADLHPARVAEEQAVEWFVFPAPLARPLSRRLARAFEYGFIVVGGFCFSLLVNLRLLFGRRHLILLATRSLAIILFESLPKHWPSRNNNSHHLKDGQR